MFSAQISIKRSVRKKLKRNRVDVADTAVHILIAYPYTRQLQTGTASHVSGDC